MLQLVVVIYRPTGFVTEVLQQTFLIEPERRTRRAIFWSASRRTYAHHAPDGWTAIQPVSTTIASSGRAAANSCRLDIRHVGRSPG